MTVDRIAQLLLSAAGLLLLSPVLFSYLSDFEIPVLFQIALLILATALLLTAWATTPKFREALIVELPWLFPGSK